MSEYNRKDEFYIDFKVFIEAVNKELIRRDKISINWYSTLGSTIGIGAIPVLGLGYLFPDIRKKISKGIILNKIKKENNNPVTISLQKKLEFAKKEFNELQMLMTEDPQFAKSEIEKLFDMLIQSN